MGKTKLVVLLGVPLIAAKCNANKPLSVCYIHKC